MMDAEGTATVTGPGSTWTIAEEIRVGNAGVGSLMIQAGGSVSAATGSIAAEANSTGTATIAGADSNLIIDGRLAIGGNAAAATNGGTGTLRIQAGGAVTVAQDILLFPNGLVDFEGGTLSTSAVSFQAGGEFEWTGGTLHVEVFHGDLVNQGGTLAPGQSPGSTAIVGDYTQQAAGTLQI
jgi:T5SS/PEP-CTERM-associated repeat protein